jgi:hypothetical protein
MRARQGRHNYLRTVVLPHLNPTRRKWSKFKNDQLPGQTWSNLVKSGQKKMVKRRLLCITDPCSSLLHQIEIQNDQAVNELTERDFTLAGNLKRSVIHMTAEQQESRCVTTQPNMKARRLKPMWISHAGEWFKQTNGGLPMNDDDAIIALEMQRLSQVTEQLEKKRRILQQCKNKVSQRQQCWRQKATTLPTGP